MKKLFLLMAMMVTTIAVQAQHEEGDITIQPRVGISYSNITDGNKWKLNIAYGVEFEYYLAEQFSLAGGVLFTNQGCKYDVYSDDNKVTDETIKLNLYYGTLPITANYYILPGLALKAGIQPAFRVKANVVQGSEKLDFDKMVAAFYGNDVKMNKFDLSIPVGLSYEFKGITLDARYNFGLTKLLSDGDKIYNKVFVVTLGYKLGTH
jgi:hypothetical protein